jgi:hypothetical protein
MIYRNSDDRIQERIPILPYCTLQGGLDFSEVTSAKWIFDVEIEKLRAEIFFACREDQSHAWC